MLGREHVLITDQKGIIEEIVAVEDAGDDVQQFNGILSPGLINCHCHLELSHMKGLIPEETGLVDFVFKVVNERHFPEEEIKDAIRIAENGMRDAGIVAVGDICNNLTTLHQKQQQHLAYYNFIEVSGWIPAVAAIRFEKSFAYYQNFLALNNQVSLSPHAPYSVSDELWELIQVHFNNKTITIHNQETAFEDLLFSEASGDFTRMYAMMGMDTSFFQPTGKSSLQSYFTKLANAQQVLLVHNTFTKEEDVLFARNNHPSVNWCICINANKYIEKAVPDIDMLRKNNCSIVLGTDSLASNHQLNILEEIKTITTHFPAITLEESLQWATINGARALQMDQTLGSFEAGKKPGIVLIDTIHNNKITASSKSTRIV